MPRADRWRDGNYQRNRKHLATESRKHRQANRIRKAEIARAVATTCPRCHREPAGDTHEIINRSQHRGIETDLRYMEPLGPNCHRFLTAHPDIAKAEGWQLRADQYDDPDALADAWLTRLEADTHNRG